MVAKSYQSLPIEVDPYTVNGRQYVKVRTAKGALKQVRWYTEAEYNKMYPAASAASASTDGVIPASVQRHALGFDSGFINIFIGDTHAYVDWFRNQKARFTRLWGWGIPGDQEITEEIPAALSMVRLDWSLVGNDNGSLVPENEVKAAVEKLIYPPTESEWQGTIGEKLDLYLTCEKVIEVDGYYGTSFLHTFWDDCGNDYVWTTASRRLEEGTQYHIIGIVKEHKLYRGSKQTNLKNCRVQND